MHRIDLRCLVLASRGALELHLDLENLACSFMTLDDSRAVFERTGEILKIEVEIQGAARGEDKTPEVYSVHW